MGSSCSIINDTEYDVWMHHGVNWTVLIGTVSGVGVLLTAGAAGVAIAAGAGGTAAAAGAAATGGSLVAAEGVTVAATTLGMTATQCSIASLVTSATVSSVAIALSISREDAEKLQKKVKEFQRDSKLIRPGEKYTWTGTLSLTKRVYVMNDKLQCDDKACFTGATANSERVYTISKDFTNLDVKKS